MFDDVIEQLEQVDSEIAHFGLGVKIRAPLLVEDAQFLDELFIFGGAVDRVLDGGFRRCHFGASSAARRRKSVRSKNGSGGFQKAKVEVFLVCGRSQKTRRDEVGH